MLRWAILGTGAAAETIAPALRAVGHDLAAVASRSRTRAQGFAANHGVRRARGNYADVLDASDVDAVLVALPNDLHEEWSVAALKAGKHVLCPAPLAADGESAGRMAAASASAGRVLVHGMACRYHPRLVAALDLVWAGGIGEVRLVTVSASKRLRDPRSYRTRVGHGGGALLDLGVHGVAVTRWLASSEPVSVSAAQTRWSTGVDGATGAVLAFSNGVIATVQVSFDAASHESLQIAGTDGTLLLPDAFTAGNGDGVALLRDGAVVGSWRADPYERLVTAFAASVAGDPTAVDHIDDAVATIEALDRIRVAAL
jgi:D-xylose 1-dehydrogenase (NADP+, D-xylono-1,5-lactone-forming)